MDKERASARFKRWPRVCLGALLALQVAARANGQMPGDVDCSSRVDDTDLSTLTAVLFGDGTGSCGGADVNQDRQIEGGDLVALIRLLTAPSPPGPTITFLGLAGANGVATTPLGEIAGVPVYFRNAGSGFKLVIEGAAGTSGVRPGMTTFDRSVGDPSRRPDLQI